VLLVDDELSGAEVLALLLAGEGCQVTLAADGRQALSRLAEAAPDILIVDFMMPGMNGAELVKAMREIPGYEQTPVLMISGAPETALRRYQARYDLFLRKPFGLEEFLAALAKLREGEARTSRVPSELLSLHSRRPRDGSTARPAWPRRSSRSQPRRWSSCHSPPPRRPPA
jgi:CheY-like chemotaxis protein